MSGDNGSISAFGLYVGADSLVMCHHYGDETPILVIDVEGCSVSISVKGRDASESAVEFARSLARHAQAFATDVERLHAETTPPGTVAVHPALRRLAADPTGLPVSARTSRIFIPAWPVERSIRLPTPGACLVAGLRTTLRRRCSWVG
jgi:hypothetical protein